MDDPAAIPVGFIGLGVMGRSMAGHLLAAGHPLHVFTRTRSTAEDLLASGAHWHDSPAELAPHCQVIITMVGFPPDVDEVYFGATGLLEAVQAGCLLIDCTTSSPALAQRIAATGAARGCACLDAPVSGGDVGAREARLSIMVGGDTEAVERARPLLERLGRTITHVGPAGAGQHCKMANQIVIAASMLGVSEALGYVRGAGLDAERVLQAITGGAAGSWTLDNLAPRMLAGDFAPGFFVKHFIKDMGIAQEEAASMGLETPGLQLALQRYRELAEAGGGDEGTQALYRLYQR